MRGPPAIKRADLSRFVFMLEARAFQTNVIWACTRWRTLLPVFQDGCTSHEWLGEDYKEAFRFCDMGFMTQKSQRGTKDPYKIRLNLTWYGAAIRHAISTGMSEDAIKFIFWASIMERAGDMLMAILTGWDDKKIGKIGIIRYNIENIQNQIKDGAFGESCHKIWDALDRFEREHTLGGYTSCLQQLGVLQKTNIRSMTKYGVIFARIVEADSMGQNATFYINRMARPFFVNINNISTDNANLIQSSERSFANIGVKNNNGEREHWIWFIANCINENIRPNEEMNLYGYTMSKTNGRNRRLCVYV
jgi:hypothetical protein